MAAVVAGGVLLAPLQPMQLLARLRQPQPQVRLLVPGVLRR
jgi:hypothetical protein